MANSKIDPKVDKYLIDGCMRCSLGATPDCKIPALKTAFDALTPGR